LALRERELGNEFFKSNDFEEALRHYNTSISIHSSPEAKNNRAMSCKCDVLLFLMVILNIILFGLKEYNILIILT